MDIFNLNDSRTVYGIKKRIVIIGGGFGGIELARRIDTKKFNVLLIDKHNYFTFQPLLYQVASGGLEPDSVAYPLRKILRRNKKVVFRLAEVIQINTNSKSVQTNIGIIPFDKLVIACGSSTNFFNMKETQEHALSLKSVTDALNMRSFILQNFEAALLSNSKEEQKRLMNFVVVGGGPTGVEISGSLAELKRHVLPEDYPELDISMMNITIVESGANVLDVMSDFAKKKSKAQLLDLGVKLMMNSQLISYDGKEAKLKDGTVLQTSALIWTAGVKGNIPEGFTPDLIVRGNRLNVDDFNRVKNLEDVFAIGDIASLESNPHPRCLHQLQSGQGKNLAKNLNKKNESDWKPFKYIDKGTMATP